MKKIFLLMTVIGLFFVSQVGLADELCTCSMMSGATSIKIFYEDNCGKINKWQIKADGLCTVPDVMPDGKTVSCSFSNVDLSKYQCSMGGGK